jgi:hypothetical protein
MVKDLSSPMFVFRNKDQKPLPRVESRARMLVVGKFYEKPNITKLTPEQANKLSSNSSALPAGPTKSRRTLWKRCLLTPTRRMASVALSWSDYIGWRTRDKSDWRFGARRHSNPLRDSRHSRLPGSASSVFRVVPDNPCEPSRVRSPLLPFGGNRDGRAFGRSSSRD